MKKNTICFTLIMIVAFVASALLGPGGGLFFWVALIVGALMLRAAIYSLIDTYTHVCDVCDHRQRKGAWEKAMDVQARAMGATGFYNISAEAQCLNCGSRELRDPLVHNEQQPEFITVAAEEIFETMRSFLQSDADDVSDKATKRLTTIGESLYEKGGWEAMSQAFKSARNIAHRRLGERGSTRIGRLNGIWSGIGDWLA